MNYDDAKKFSNNAAKLADILEQVPDEQHDQRFWVGENESCGTVCCAMGWAAHSGEFEGLTVKKDKGRMTYWLRAQEKTLEMAMYIPVFNGEKSTFECVGKQLFGLEITSDIFYNTSATRLDTIAALREKAVEYCDLAKTLSTGSGVGNGETTP